MTTTSWPGQIGIYTYWLVHTLDPDAIINEPGNYIMAKPIGDGRWEALYIGSTPNGGTLQARLPNHERWEAAKKLGATAIWAHTSKDAAARSAEERDLIAHLNPVLNIQHRTALTGLRGLLG